MHPARAALLMVLLVLPLSGCLAVPTPQAVDVLVTHYPLEFLASRIAQGTNVTVGTMVPGGDPHDWEPRIHDVLRLQAAKLYLSQGAGLDWWLPGLVQDLGPDAPTVVDTTANVSLIVHPGGGAAGGTDPHTWVAPADFLQQAHAVEAAMARAFPEDAATFHANARVLDRELEALDHAYRTNLTRCATRTILVNHDAFAYLGREMNLTVESLQGLSPQVEPSPVVLAHITDLARQEGIHVVFLDGVASPRVAELLAEAVGGHTLVLSPVPARTPAMAATGGTYLTVQYQNLANLKEALGCA